MFTDTKSNDFIVPTMCRPKVLKVTTLVHNVK